MKTAVKLSLFVISLLVFSTRVFAFEGPLQVKNQYPLFLHANQPYLEKAATESSFSVGLSHSSIYTVQSSGNWLINLDMEITEFNLGYKKTMRDSFEFGIDVPVIKFRNGFMDGFLDSYHSTFGFSDYGRSERPLHDFLYEVRRNDTLVVKGETGTGLGDVRFGIKKPLVSSDDFGLAIKANLELPTGSAKKGYGSGDVGMGIGALIDKGLSEGIKAYWNFGAVFPGDLKGHVKIKLKKYIYSGAAVEAALSRSFSLIAQLQGQSSIYPRTDLKAVDGAAYLVSFGGRYSSGNSNLELSLTEDANTSGAPDFIINLAYKVKI